MNKRFVAFLLLGLIFVGAAEWELQERILKPVRKLDRFWVDFCIGNAGNRVGDPSITMVRIPDDYESVSVGLGENATGENQELTRLDFGTFLFAIGKMSPKAVSFLPTPQFAEKSVLNQTSLYPLKDSVLQLPRMTLGTLVSNEGKPATPAQNLSYPALQVTGDASQLPEIAKTEIPVDPAFLANGDPAFVPGGAFSPIGEVWPRIQLIARQGDKVVPGFVLLSVAKQAGIGVDQISVDLESKRPMIQVGTLYEIPVSADGSMTLPSHGGLKHSMYEVTTDENGKEKRSYNFASLTVGDVALAAHKSDTLATTLVEEFSGKFESLSRNLVLLGFDRTSDRTIPTANEEWLSPMTATARAIATIQSGRHTERWELPIRAAVYGAIFLLGLILLGFRNRSTFLVLLLGVAAVVAMVLVFRQTLTWTPPLAIVGLFALMFIVSLFGRGSKKAVEEKEEVTEKQIEATEAE